jgi:hypothetical protein
LRENPIDIRMVLRDYKSGRQAISPRPRLLENLDADYDESLFPPADPAGARAAKRAEPQDQQ